MGAGALALDGIIGAGLGLATASWNDQRQLDQQRQLQSLAIEGQQQMAQFNEGLAIDQWQKTGPVAQMQQLQKAGLNPGLMYGAGAGGGGTLQQPNNGSIGIGDAPKGGGEIQAMMGLGLMGAQQDNLKADTKKKEVEADKIAGVDTAAVQQGITESQAQVTKLGQETKNLEVTNAILQQEKNIKEVEANIAGSTQGEVIKKVGLENDSLNQTIEQQATNNKISRESADDLIKANNLANMETALRMGAIKAGIFKTNAETANTQENTKLQAEQLKQVQQATMNLVAEYSATKQGQEREWAKLSQKDKELAIQKQLADFNTNDAAHIKQWTSIITDVLETFGIGKYLKGASKVAPATPQVRDRNGRTQPKGWTDVLK